MAGQPRERSPTFEGILIGGPIVGEMVRTEQARKAKVFHRRGDTLPARPSQSILSFDHDGYFKHSTPPNRELPINLQRAGCCPPCAHSTTSNSTDLTSAELPPSISS